VLIAVLIVPGRHPLYQLVRLYAKMDLEEIGWDGRDWIKLAQDRDQWRALVNTVMNLRGSLKLLGIF
jgi:hypothetical protein